MSKLGPNPFQIPRPRVIYNIILRKAVHDLGRSGFESSLDYDSDPYK